MDKCEEEQITTLIVKAGKGNETTLLKSVIFDIDDNTLKYMICLDMPKCTEWFPNSGYDQDVGHRQERCYWREDGKMVVEAWIPIKNNS